MPVVPIWIHLPRRSTLVSEDRPVFSRLSLIPEGIATRMAYMVPLNSVSLADSLVEREVKCRIWCSLFMADRWCSAGLALPRQIPNLTARANVPMSEYVFQQMTCQQQNLSEMYQPGLWAHKITLVDIFGPVQDLNCRLVQDDLPEEIIETETANLAHRFEAWEAQLPSSVTFSLVNLDRHQ